MSTTDEKVQKQNDDGDEVEPFLYSRVKEQGMLEGFKAKLSGPETAYLDHHIYRLAKVLGNITETLQKLNPSELEELQKQYQHRAKEMK